MIVDAPGFLHIDAGNIITWGVVAIAWLVNRSMDWRKMRDDIKGERAWRAKHEEDECKQDDVISKLNDTIQELKGTNKELRAFNEYANRRLERLEEVYFKRSFGTGE